MGGNSRRVEERERGKAERMEITATTINVNVILFK